MSITLIKVCESGKVEGQYLVSTVFQFVHHRNACFAVTHYTVSADIYATGEFKTILNSLPSKCHSQLSANSRFLKLSILEME